MGVQVHPSPPAMAQVPPTAPAPRRGHADGTPCVGALSTGSGAWRRRGLGWRWRGKMQCFFLIIIGVHVFFLLLTVNQSDVDSLYDIRWQVILGSGQWFSELRCWIDSLLSSFRGDMCLYNYMICNLDILVPCLFYTSGYQPTMTGCGCGSRTVSPRN